MSRLQIQRDVALRESGRTWPTARWERPDGTFSYWTLFAAGEEGKKLDAVLSRARQPRLPGPHRAALELEPQEAASPALIRYLALWPYESAGGERLAVASHHYALPTLVGAGGASISLEDLDAWAEHARARKQVQATPAVRAELHATLERLLALPPRKRPRPLGDVRCDRLVRLPAGGLYPLTGAEDAGTAGAERAALDYWLARPGGAVDYLPGIPTVGVSAAWADAFAATVEAANVAFARGVHVEQLRALGGT